MHLQYQVGVRRLPHTMHYDAHRAVREGGRSGRHAAPEDHSGMFQTFRGIVACIESVVFYSGPFTHRTNPMSNVPANHWALRRYPDDEVRTYPPDTMLRRNQVCEMVGKKKSSLYKAIADGEFPEPKKIGKRAVAWSANVVFQWMAERPSAR
jgi:prophage regulatory protein